MATDSVKPVLVVLGAGKPFRGQRPVGLTESRERFAPLDWCLHAFAAVEPEVHFVGGYHFEEVVREYPHLRYSVNLNWATTGSAASLLLTPLDAGRTYYVAYGDVIVSTDAVAALARADAASVILVDRQASAERISRSPEIVKLNGASVTAIGPSVSRVDADALYVGLAKLSPAAIAAIRRFRDESGSKADHWSVAQLLGEIVLPMEQIEALDTAGKWASLDAPQEIARFLIGSKAETLERLAPLVRASRVLESVVTTVGDWRSDPDAYLDRVQAAFRSQDVIVRSSARSEDAWTGSQAGRFRSIKSVSADNRQALARAIDEVVSSYLAPTDRDQVMAQPMLYPRSSGVVMTRTLAQGGPYYVVGYAEGGTATSAVTSGGDGAIETVIVHRDFNHDGVTSEIPGWTPTVQRVLPAVRELETLIGHDALDVEFAVADDETVVLLQLRPIAADFSQWSASDQKVAQLVSQAAAIVRAQHDPPPFHVGRLPAWGSMPDWNPAEIIGERPRPLAFSLYQHLITDEIWATQRAEMGYRDLRPTPLVVSLAGHPYVDVRASLNSFIPATLPDELAAVLVDIYVDRLRREPALHDKVEFEVAETCLTLDAEHRIQSLCADGFPASGVDAFRVGLTDVTNRAWTGIPEALAAIEQLDSRRARILAAGLSPIGRASALLADAVRFGTLPFAHLARRAFVATALLRSGVSAGLFDDSTLSAFTRSLQTVASQLAADAARAGTGALPREELLARYGHLRPGTYEITSLTYAESFADAGLATAFPRPESADFEWPAPVVNRLDRAFAALGLTIDAARFDRFCRDAIEGREFSKFCFTRNVSAALDIIVDFGSSVGLSRDDLSFLSWTDLKPLASGHAIDAGALKQRADRNREHHAVVRAVELPPLIFKPEDLWCFRLEKSRPNFIGSGRVVAPVALLEDKAERRHELRGAIAMTMQADPGWDWLLTEGISGLITAFGGANSHMAVRAAELGLSAAIGVGALQFDRLCQARVLLLDCDSRRVEIVS